MLSFQINLRSVIATAMLFWAGAAVAGEQSRPTGSEATESKRSTADSQRRLSVGEIAARVEAQGYRDIEEIEREGDSYEVCAEDSRGREVELTVNSTTGKVEKVELCDE